MRRVVFWCLTVGAVLHGGASRAADPPEAVAPPGTAERPEADTLFHEGVAALHAQDWERARKLFRASYDLVPRGTTLQNLGQAEMELGSLVEGLHHLREALAMLMTAEESKKVVAQRAFDAAYATTGHLTVRTKPGASVLIDGAVQPGTAPFAEALDVVPGKRLVEARLDQQTVRQEVEAPAGSLVEVEMPLPDPVGLSSPAGTGAIAPAPTALDRAAGTEPSRRSSSWWTAPRIVGVVAGAGAVVATGVGIYFHEAAVNAGNDVGGLRSNPLRLGQCAMTRSAADCSMLAAKISDIGNDNTAAHISWAVGGAAAAGAVVAFILAARLSPPRSTGGVRPWIGVDSVGLNGSF